MSEVTKPTVSYGKGAPVATTTGSFYKDLNTDILYQKLSSGEWEIKPTQPQYKMYAR